MPQRCWSGLQCGPGGLVLVGSSRFLSASEDIGMGHGGSGFRLYLLRFAAASACSRGVRATLQQQMETSLCRTQEAASRGSGGNERILSLVESSLSFLPTGRLLTRVASDCGVRAGP